MAEDIIQRIGFETGDSVGQITALTQALSQLNSALTTVSSGMRN